MRHVIGIFLSLLLAACQTTGPVRESGGTPEVTSPGQPFQGETVVQLGHTQPVHDVIYAHDGSFIVTASIDAVKLWTTDGRLIRSIEPVSSNVIALSPDDRTLVFGTWGQLQLWSVTGKRLQIIQGPPGILSAVAFSRDGKSVAACNVLTSDNACRLFDLQGRPLARLVHPPGEPIRRIVFSSDGSIYTAAAGNVYRWRPDGHLVGKFKAADDTVASLDVSPDGSLLLTNVAYRLRSQARSAERTGELLGALWTPEGKRVRRFPSHATGSARFSADGRWIVSGGDFDNQVLVQDLNGKVLHHFKVGYNSTTSPAEVTLSPDRRYVVTADRGLHPPGLYFWTLDGRKVRAFNEFNAQVNDLAMSDDGSLLVTVSSDRYVRIWSLLGRMIRRFRAQNDWVEKIAITPNQQAIVTAGDDLVIWNPEGKKLGQFRVHPKKGTRAMAFTPDGKTLVTGGGDGYVNIIPLEEGHRALRFKPFDGRTVTSLAIHPGGKLFATGSSWEQFRIWDLKGNLKASFAMPKGTKPPFSEVDALTFTPDGHYLVTVSKRPGQEIRLFDLNARLVGVLHMPIHNEQGDVRFSPSGRWLAVSDLGNIAVWDFPARKLRGYLTGHHKFINRLAFTPDDQHLVSASGDGTVRVWSLADGQSYGMVADGDQWAVFTKDGYFDASKHGSDLLAVVDGMNAYGVDQFALYLNRPDLIYRRVGVGDPALIEHYHALYEKRLAQAQLSPDSGPPTLDAPTARIVDYRQFGKFLDLDIEVKDRTGLAAIQVYDNDVPLFAGAGKPVAGTTQHVTRRVELTGGKNKIEVSAVNREQAVSPRALVMAEYRQRVKGDLYFVGIGVSRYRDAKLNLRYAANDALALERLMHRYRNSFRKIHTLTLVDEQATRGNLQRVHQFLAGAGVDDMIILSVSGHGAFELSDDASYYFLSWGTDVDHLAETAIPYDALQSLLRDVAPRRKLLLLDTCESGEVDPATLEAVQAVAREHGLSARTSSALLIKYKYSKPRRWLYARDRYINNTLTRSNGAIVFSSSEGGELSFEDDKLRDGFFTAAILAGLSSPEVDTNRDGRIDIPELEAFVRLRVTRQTANLQHPTIDRDNIYQEFSLPVLGK